MLRENEKQRKPEYQAYELPLDRNILYLSMIDLLDSNCIKIILCILENMILILYYD